MHDPQQPTAAIASRISLAALGLALLLGTGCEQQPAPADSQRPVPLASSTDPAGGPVSVQLEEVREIDWDALIPHDWRPDKLMNEYNADELEDDDPRAKELMLKLKHLWREAPVVDTFQDRLIRIPGFVVPLDMDGGAMGEFLLVPYYGACIHVPPPPANQTIYAVTRRGEEYRGELYDTIWLTGTLRVEATSSDLADAGYRVDVTAIEPYQDAPDAQQER
jgi:hypothetical protein